MCIYDVLGVVVLGGAGGLMEGFSPLGRKAGMSRSKSRFPGLFRIPNLAFHSYILPVRSASAPEARRSTIENIQSVLTRSQTIV
jgi:hypothetical protein